MTIIYQVLTHILVGGGMGKPRINLSLQAYCMDGGDFRGDKSKDLRGIFGLGGFNCCDYFCPMGNYVMLIEEKQLFAKKDTLEKQFCGLNVDQAIVGQLVEESVDNDIRHNIRAKLYGSLLLLYSLKYKCATVNSMVKDKPYKFYLIVSDDNRDIRYMDSLRDNLTSDMKGALKIVEDVIVCSPDDFKTIFNHLLPTNTNQTP